MKALLISYLFPPIWEAQAVRWYYLTKELAKLGINIDILTISLPFEEDLDLPKNINIFRISPGPFEKLFFKVKFKFGTESNKIFNKSSTFRTSKLFVTFKNLYHIGRNFLSFLMFGEIRNEWYFKARRWLDQINFKNYQILITSHEPMVDSFLGLYLKRKYPHLFWLADLADPFTAPYYPLFWKPLLKNLEKKILNNANLIMITTQKLKEKLIAKYNISSEKFLVIPQGFDWNFYLSEDLNNEKNYKNSIFTLFYAGSFYKKFRDPTELFKALEEFPHDFRFYLAGRIEKFLPQSPKLRNKIIYLGILPHPEILKWERRSDLLIYIANALEDQVSGKFFEYLGSRKPILCITYNNKITDEISILLKTLNLGKIVLNNKEEILKALFEFYKNFNHNQLILNTLSQDLLYKFTWQYYAKKIYDYLLNRCLIS